MYRVLPLLVLLIGLFTILGSPYAGASESSPTSSINNSVLSSMVRELPNPPQEDEVFPKTFAFDFQHSEQHGVLTNTRTIVAWQFAAAACALLTENPSPTCQEVIDAGLWPFQTEDKVNLDKTPGDAGDVTILSAEQLTDIGSADWFLETRSTILNHFYNEYYFNNYQRYDPQTYAEPLTPDMLIEDRAFWTNPLTKATYVEGIDKGEFRFAPADSFCLSNPILLTDTEIDQVSFKQLNLLPNADGKLIYLTNELVRSMDRN